MRMRPLLVALAGLAASHACTEPSSAPPPGFEDVVLEGEVGVETLGAVARALEIKPVLPGGPGLKFTWPADGEVIPEEKGGTTSFCWVFTSSARGPRPGVSSAPDARWAALPGPVPAARSRGWSDPLAELLGPVRQAHAEPAPPYEGVVSYAVFSSQGDPALVRVLTSRLDYGPDPAAWKKMAAAVQPITLRVVTATVEAGYPIAGGPYAGAEMTFTIAP